MIRNGSYRAVARQPRLADQVAQQIRDLIAAGNLLPGDRLPTERELAESFGVSRTVVRETLRALAGQGLVDLPGGRGAVVLAPPSAGLGLRLGLPHEPEPQRKLFEVRRLIEVEIAGLAATRATPADWAALLAAVDRLVVAETAGAVAAADAAFHGALARATGNELFGLLVSAMPDALLAMWQAVLTHPGARQAAAADHQRLVACLQAADAVGARQTMRAHLAEEEQRWLGSATPG